jgi:hypothetical protein
MMKGRPFLGAISGFFFGLFGGITLFLFGVIPLDSHLLWILPIVGIVLGLFMATWAPFGKGAKSELTAPPASTPAAATPADTDDTVVDENPPVEQPTNTSDATEDPQA